MAKMFYTLEEAAERLGISEDEVKALASQGKLQQFRDREKLMFKRDQVESLSSGLDDSGDIPLATGSGDTDQIDLDASGAEPPKKEDPRHATGISVFDAGEVEMADPMAQTQVTSGMVDDEELALESVGSGSGLLDLTRESDDTSLGAELLEDIYPAGEASDAKLEPPSSSGFEGTISDALSGGSGLENLAPTATMDHLAPVQTVHEPYDPAGSFLSAGLLVGAVGALVVLMIVIFSLVQGTPITLTQTLAGEPDSATLLMYCGIILAASVVLGVVGYLVGKSQS